MGKKQLLGWVILIVLYGGIFAYMVAESSLISAIKSYLITMGLCAVVGGAVWLIYDDKP